MAVATDRTPQQIVADGWCKHEPSDALVTRKARRQLAELARERDRLAEELAEVRQRVATLRHIATEAAQLVEDVANGRVTDALGLPQRAASVPVARAQGSQDAAGRPYVPSEQRPAMGLRDLIRELRAAGWRHTVTAELRNGRAVDGAPWDDGQEVHRWRRPSCCGTEYVELVREYDGTLCSLEYYVSDWGERTGWTVIDPGWLRSTNAAALYLVASALRIFEPDPEDSKVGQLETVNADGEAQ